MDNYICPKCKHEIPAQNKVLHDLRCNGPIKEETKLKNEDLNDQNNSNLNQNTQNPNIQNINQNTQNPYIQNINQNTQNPNIQNINQNTQNPNIQNINQNTQNPNIQNINQNTQNPNVENLINQNIANSVKIEPEEIVLFTCDKCNQTMEMKEKEDHLLLHKLQEEEYKENREERKREEERLRERHEQQRNGRRIIRESNGCTRESYEETLDNGDLKIISILRDPQGNIISKQENVINNNNNRNNNNNNNNNNNRRRGLYDDDDDNNGSHRIEIDNNGNRVETIIRNTPNGTTMLKIVKDRNGNIISRQQMNQMGGMNMNRMNNMNMNMNMNPLMNNMNMNMNPLMNNMNFYDMFPNYNSPNFSIEPLNTRNGLISSFNNFDSDFESLFNNNPFFQFLRLSNFQGFPFPNNNNRTPINPRILQSLPEITLDDISKLDNEKKNCIICLENFKVGEKVIILPCVHIFHSKCIKNWFTAKDECPMCKFKLTPENLQRNYQ